MSANSTLNVSNSSLQQDVGCYAVKCHFTVNERVAIIFALFVTFMASFAGNFLVLFLITRTRQLRNCTNFSIVNLCIADLLITIICIPMLTVDFYIADEWLFGAFMCKMMTFLQKTVVDASVMILFTMSIEKFTVICFPLKSRVYRKWFRYIVLLGWLIALADASHFTTFTKLTPIKGFKKCIMDYPKDPLYRNYFLAGHSIAFFFLPLSIMTVLHCITVLAIQRKITGKGSEHKGTKLRLSHTKLHRNRKAVAILVTMVVLFLVTWGPYFSLRMWDTFYTPDPNNSHSYYLVLNKVYVLCIWLKYFNSACHPVIYCFLGRKYSDELKTLFQQRQRGKSSDKSSSESALELLKRPCQSSRKCSQNITETKLRLK